MEKLRETLVPKSRREWIKFLVNLVIVIFFIYVLAQSSLMYREGYDTGMRVCQNQHLVNLTVITHNLTTISP